MTEKYIYDDRAVGILELDSECMCFVALDVAAKTSRINLQAIERNRLGKGACLKIRGNISDIQAAIDSAESAVKDKTVVLAKCIMPAPTEGTDMAIRMTVGK